MAAPTIETPNMSGWFAEKEDDKLWPGQRFALKVKNVLHTERSEFQDILVFDSETYGRVLVLDGVIQLTEKDEFAYQEMITHLPLFAHPNPKKVLILGAGDGGVLREVCRHAGVEKIVQCEIDRRVVEVSKQFFGSTMATSFEDPRVTLLFDDAAKYIADKKNEFDVIIVDSSDPNEGPATSLFTPEFYKNLSEALKEGGIVCTQGECMWQNMKLITEVLNKAKAYFPVVDYAYTCVPTYPSGQIGFLVCSKSGCPVYARSAKRAVPADLAAKLRYYTSAAHRAAFVLPSFAEKELVSVRPESSTCSSVFKCKYVAAATGVAVVAGLTAAFFGGRFSVRK